VLLSLGVACRTIRAEERREHDEAHRIRAGGAECSRHAKRSSRPTGRERGAFESVEASARSHETGGDARPRSSRGAQRPGTFSSRVCRFTAISAR
jgi:hypothetical protein